jgi:hypothetical protein
MRPSDRRARYLEERLLLAQDTLGNVQSDAIVVYEPIADDPDISDERLEFALFEVFGAGAVHHPAWIAAYRVEPIRPDDLLDNSVALNFPPMFQETPEPQLDLVLVARGQVRLQPLAIAFERDTIVVE